ncbi:hypothetical protein ACFQZE_11705 [Paenibacillus sp. GCM10027627]|uniref:hypothetical protein n=1 Tax=unclassified Paenibacillus TaxID=185978 RepID=UPI003643EBA5
MTAFNIRIFNFATGDFDGTISLGLLPVGYYRSRRRGGKYEVTLAVPGLYYPKQTVFVSPELMRFILPTGADPVCGYIPVRYAYLRQLGFILLWKGRAAV